MKTKVQLKRIKFFSYQEKWQPFYTNLRGTVIAFYTKLKLDMRNCVSAASKLNFNF